jgi:hypothetical protein
MHTDRQGSSGASTVIVPQSGQLSISTATPTIVVTGTSSGAPPFSGTTQSAHAAPTPPAETETTRDVEGAVFGYIRAIRALGRMHVSTDEIARALGLSLAEVQGTLAALRSRGVNTA